MAQDMQGKDDSLLCHTPTRVHSLSEEDAWRARQILASSQKRLQRSSSNDGGSAAGSSPPAGLAARSRPLSAGNDVGIGFGTDSGRGAAAYHSKVGHRSGYVGVACKKQISSQIQDLKFQGLHCTVMSVLYSSGLEWRLAIVEIFGVRVWVVCLCGGDGDGDGLLLGH